MTSPATRDEDISCRTKVPYETRGDAKRALKWLRRQPGRRHLQVYKCRYCPCFHIGNPPGFQTYRRSGAPFTAHRDTAA
ncbi:hypothetical protein [Streptomyces sp. YIM S03343]